VSETSRMSKATLLRPALSRKEDERFRAARAVARHGDHQPLWYIAPVMLANQVYSASLRGNIVGDRKSNRWTDG
jgi:hypothetical protein